MIELLSHMDRFESSWIILWPKGVLNKRLFTRVASEQAKGFLWDTTKTRVFRIVSNRFLARLKHIKITPKNSKAS